MNTDRNTVDSVDSAIRQKHGEKDISLPALVCMMVLFAAIPLGLLTVLFSGPPAPSMVAVANGQPTPSDDNWSDIWQWFKDQIQEEIDSFPDSLSNEIAEKLFDLSNADYHEDEGVYIPVYMQNTIKNRYKAEAGNRVGVWAAELMEEAIGVTPDAPKQPGWTPGDPTCSFNTSVSIPYVSFSWKEGVQCDWGDVISDLYNGDFSTDIDYISGSASLNLYLNSGNLVFSGSVKTRYYMDSGEYDTTAYAYVTILFD